MTSSVDTPGSLLERLRQLGDEDAWKRFVRLYTPLLFHWAARAGLTGEPAQDLVQDVLVVLVQKLPEFRYDPAKSFRGWLRTVALNKWRERHRRAAAVEHADFDVRELPEAPQDAFWESEYRIHLTNCALRLMRTDFQPAAWRACWELVVNGRPAKAVAAELGISVKAVYHAKYRVLSRLRQELSGFLE